MKIQPPRRTPEDEQRLMVLFCLARLGPCTELQLLQFLFEYDVMNYFDMMFALSDLCTRGQTVRTRKNAGFEYQVTEAGQEALELFGKRVPNSLKTLLSENESAWKARFKQETQSQQQIVQTDRGEYEVNFRVVEKDMDMMRLTLSLPTRELAEMLAKRWKDKAGKVYETVIRILTEDEA
ncbi:MAG: DUF4364 family protein [Clostridia bacterium]|nr:DUF4364 family protein [Clostridia bacterium]